LDLEVGFFAFAAPALVVATFVVATLVATALVAAFLGAAFGDAALGLRRGSALGAPTAFLAEATFDLARGRGRKGK